MTENIGNILFVIAGCLWAIELIPQLRKTIRTKSVGDISLFFLTLCFIAYVVFLFGCYFIQNWFLLFAHLVPAVNVSILLYLVCRYKNPKDRLKYFHRKKVKELQKKLPNFIINGECQNNGKYICNEGYACDACPYNKEIK